MAIHTQRSTFDTCASPSCQFHENWDDAINDVARTHTCIAVERLCARHVMLEPLAAYTACYDENRRKNITLSAIQTMVSDFSHQQYRWSYSHDGLLTVDLSGHLTTTQKTQLQAILDIQFGPNKAMVK